jgi:hypothetical protein
MTPIGEESEKSKAELTAEKAKATGPRPWYLKTEVLVTLGVVAFLILANTIKPIDTEPSQTSKSESSKATQEAAPPKPVAPWYPSDFKEITSNVAYKRFDPGTADCGYSTAHSCFQIYVVTNIDCELYVSVNFLKNDVVVDDGIDSASVQAGQAAILTFASLESARYSGDGTVKFTDVTCY